MPKFGHIPVDQQLTGGGGNKGTIFAHGPLAPSCYATEVVSTDSAVF